MKRLIAFVPVLLIALPLLGLDGAVSSGKRIAVIDASRDSSGVDRAIRSSMPAFLVEELKRAGLDAYLVKRSMEEITRDGDGPRQSPPAYYLEVAQTSSRGGPLGGIGTGTRIGSVGVGTEVGIVTAHVGAEIRLYDGETLELVDSFTAEGRAASPAITSVGLGGRDGYLYVAVPFLARHPYRKASRDVARDAAIKLSQRE